MRVTHSSPRSMITAHVHTAMVFSSTEKTNTTDIAGHTAGGASPRIHPLDDGPNRPGPRGPSCVPDRRFTPGPDIRRKKFLPAGKRSRKSIPHKATSEKSSLEETFRVVRSAKTRTNDRSTVTEPRFPGRRCPPERGTAPVREDHIRAPLPRAPHTSGPAARGTQNVVPPIPHDRRNRRHVSPPDTRPGGSRQRGRAASSPLRGHGTHGEPSSRAGVTTSEPARRTGPPCGRIVQPSR